MKNFDEFQWDMKNDKTLFRNLMEKAEKAQGSAEQKRALFVACARALGYDIAVEELLPPDAMDKELDDEELRNVSGGGFFSCPRLLAEDGDTEWCWESYGCIFATN